MSKWRLLDEIYYITRDYSTRTYSLPFVCRKVIEYMRAGGSQAFITDDTHRNYRILRIDDHFFRIYRDHNSLRYEADPID